MKMVWQKPAKVWMCNIRAGLAEKVMAPQFSTLAWKIPWMEEPGGLQSMGLQRVGHDWETSLSLFTFMHWRRKWQPTPVFLPGESQGWGSLVGCHLCGHTVGHDWSDLAAAAAAALSSFGASWFFMVEPVLCIVGCLKTSLALTHFMPVGPPNLWQPEVSPDVVKGLLVGGGCKVAPQWEPLL